MKILGIDYGRRKIGLAFADGPLAEPIKVIHYLDVSTAVEEIKRYIVENYIEKVVIGVSEGVMGEESKNFGLNIGKMVDIPVETSDETLSTQDAQMLSREAGIRQKRRREMEDAYAASIMLQNYLDNNR